MCQVPTLSLLGYYNGIAHSAKLYDPDIKQILFPKGSWTNIDDVYLTWRQHLSFVVRECRE